MAVLFARVFVLLGQVLSALGVVSGLAQNSAQEHIKYEVENTVVATSLNVANPTYGLSALHDQIVALAGLVSALAVDVAAIPTGPQLAGHAVTLPSTAPAGYGSDPSGTAAAVWTYLVGGYTQQAGDLMLDAGMLAINLSSIRARVPSGDSKYFEIGGTWFSTSGADSDGGYPIFPIANILPTDTLGVFLERETFFHGWTANADGTWSVNQDASANDFYIHTKITDAEFLVLRDGPAAAGALVAPPVWPGLANVTLGTPAAISVGLTITAPMHGVILGITGVPTRANYYQFDDKPSYRNLGMLSFFDDNGEQEQAQVFGFEAQILTPLKMKEAAGVKLRTEGGVSGTITPWTINP